MKRRRSALRVCAAALAVVALLAAPSPGWAGAPCPVPDSLTLGDLSLPVAKAAVAKSGRLVILTVGGMSTAGAAAGDADATYPARLQAALAAALPGRSVSVINKGIGGVSTSAVLRDLPALIRQNSANLVIWASGAHEAAHNSDIEEYVANLQSGIDMIHQAGADVMLMDLQYAPSIARIMDPGPYRDAMYGAAMANDVTVVRRYEMMTAWSDDNVLDLDARDPAERRLVARHLYECLASAISPAIADAVR